MHFGKTLLTAALATSLLVPNAGCFLLGGYEGAFIERDDVSLDLYQGDGFRAAGQEGDVYRIIGDTARDVNGWVGDMVQGIATVVAYLNNHPETDRDGDWRIYGPFNDDDGRDLSWLVKIKGDAQATAYEVFVGGRGAKASSMDRVLDGDITIDSDQRFGGFRLYFDAVESHPAMKRFEHAGVTLSGSIAVGFTRDVSSEEKTIDITFEDFRAEAVLGEAWFSDETYAYHRDADGNGSFHLAVYGTFDDQAWGGIKTNKLELDARWTDDEAGRTRGRILDIAGQDSGLEHGDLVIHECFDGSGDLTWRWMTDAYAVDHPSYNMGDEATCLFGEADLG